MNTLTVATITGGIVLVVIVGVLVYRRVPKKLKVEKYICDWKELQGYCKDKSLWPNALMEADKLLDHALKRRKYKGKSMGERMVAAQRVISNNDQLWFAHNLAKKVIADPSFRLRESDVKTALIGFRQALKDLGALHSETPRTADENEGTK